MENLLDEINTLTTIAREKEFTTESFLMCSHKDKEVWVPVEKGKFENPMETENIANKFEQKIKEVHPLFAIQWQTKQDDQQKRFSISCNKSSVSVALSSYWKGSKSWMWWWYEGFWMFVKKLFTYLTCAYLEK